MHGDGRLARVLADAAAGRFPDPDGAVEVLSPPAGPADAVVAFTAHHIVAADVDPEWVRAALAAGDLGAPTKAAFLAGLARRLGAEAGTLDVVLAATAGGAPDPLVVEGQLNHPRLDRARRYRHDVRCYHDGRGGLLTIGHGLAGRIEVSVEVDAAARGRGQGRALATAALGLAPAGQPVFAQVAPGNVASVRCFLAAGYRPAGAEVLFLRG